jgi:hypothetical protein
LPPTLLRPRHPSPPAQQAGRCSRFVHRSRCRSMQALRRRFPPLTRTWMGQPRISFLQHVRQYGHGFPESTFRHFFACLRDPGWHLQHAVEHWLRLVRRCLRKCRGFGSRQADEAMQVAMASMRHALRIERPPTISRHPAPYAALPTMSSAGQTAPPLSSRLRGPEPRCIASRIEA